MQYKKRSPRGSVKKGRPATLLKKRLWHRRFPVNFVKFIRTAFFTEPLRLVLLNNKLSVISLFYTLKNKFKCFYQDLNSFDNGKFRKSKFTPF